MLLRQPLFWGSLLILGSNVHSNEGIVRLVYCADVSASLDMEKGGWAWFCTFFQMLWTTPISILTKEGIAKLICHADVSASLDMGKGRWSLILYILPDALNKPNFYPDEGRSCTANLPCRCVGFARHGKRGVEPDSVNSSRCSEQLQFLSWRRKELQS